VEIELLEVKAMLVAGIKFFIDFIKVVIEKELPKINKVVRYIPKKTISQSKSRL
jgi:uncharacterized Fe-S cluster-containing protein